MYFHWYDSQKNSKNKKSSIFPPKKLCSFFNIWRLKNNNETPQRSSKNVMFWKWNMCFVLSSINTRFIKKLRILPQILSVWLAPFLFSGGNSKIFAIYLSMIVFSSGGKSKKKVIIFDFPPEKF